MAFFTHTQINIKLKVSFILMLLNYFVSFSQNETDNWFFGENAGLNFSNGTTTVLNTGQMDTPAGCSSISDQNGDLLFYTNGQTVWNKNHQIMTNGTGLAGEIENVETALIVPNPNDANIYYIFTTRENTDTTTNPYTHPGLYYSEIHFNAQNPDGFIYQKNFRLTNYITGRICGIYHYDSNSFRVLALGSQDGNSNSLKNTFYIFKVSGNGVESSVITSTQPKSMPSYGQMKISPNGEQIAIADFEERYIYLYKFDNDNINVTFERTINADKFGTEISPYGVEFSQNSKILYYTSKINSNNVSYIVQFDMYPTGGFFEKYDVISTRSNDLGSLQLGRNGKIYVSQLRDRGTTLYGWQTIGVINKPEKTGSECDYEDSILDLENGKSLKGLPIFIASSLRNRIITDDQCVNNSFNFTTDAYAPITNIQWDFGDGNNSNSFNPTHIYSSPGNYLVKANVTLNGVSTVLYKEVIVHPLPSLAPNTTMQQCDAENDGIAYFNLNNINDKIINQNYGYSFTFYNNSNDAQLGINEIQNPELYENTTNPEQIFVKIVSDAGCENIVDFFIEAVHNDIEQVNSYPSCEDSDGIERNGEALFDFEFKKQDIINQLNLPSTSIISFYYNYQDALTKINDINGTIISPSMTLWVRVDDENFDCNGIGTFDIIVNTPVNLNIKDKYVICGNEEEIILDGGLSNDYWEWKNYITGEILSNTREFTIASPGIFSVTVSKNENGIICSLSKTFSVTKAGIINLNKIAADNGEIHILVNGFSIYEFSLNNLNFYGNGNSYTFTNLEAGLYTVYVKDIDDCELPISVDVVLLGYQNVFTPNGDGYNDTWKFSKMNDYFKDINVNIFNRYGKLLIAMNKEEIENVGWDGTFNGKKMPSSDYWFVATLTDQEGNTSSQRGHFTLKR